MPKIYIKENKIPDPEEPRDKREKAIASFITSTLLSLIGTGAFLLVYFLMPKPESGPSPVSGSVIFDAEKVFANSPYLQEDDSYIYQDDIGGFRFRITSNSHFVEIGPNEEPFSYIYHAYGLGINNINIEFQFAYAGKAIDELKVYLGEDTPELLDVSEYDFSNNIFSYETSGDIYLHHLEILFN